MDIKPIRSSSELKNAKRQLEELLKNNAFGEHDDEIEVRSIIIEKYENAQVRIDAPTPVAAIKFRMEELDLAPRGLEPFIGSRARVSEVLSGKRQLSIDMIRSLHRGLRIPYESLINERSKSADVEKVSDQTSERLSSLGFDVETLASYLPRTIAHPYSQPLLRKTRTQRASEKMDRTALALWQAAVQKRSERKKLQKTFSALKFRNQNFRRFAKLSRHVDGPKKAIQELEESGVSVVVLQHMPGTFLDGAAMLSNSGNPVIGLTLRFDRIDSFWFTLLHEAAHLALHYHVLASSNEAFIDDLDIRSEEAHEREADEFARENLIPRRFLSQVEWSNSSSQDDLISVATRARVHLSIVVGRWQREHQNYKKFARLIERNTLSSLFLNG